MKATMHSLVSPLARRGRAAYKWHMPSRRSNLITGLLSALLVASPAWAAPMLVYLDFDGHTDSTYPSGNVAISLPPFAGGPAIRQTILRHMQEDFAPFDVVFVTSDGMPQPPAEVDGGYSEQSPAIRVAIGGKVGDLGSGESGLATNPYARNTVWVVEFQSDGVTRRSDADIGNTASHELGHAFGHLAAPAAPWPWLQIPSQISHYQAELTAGEQNPFTQASHYLVPQGKTQIMNGPRAGVRDIWWRDPNVFKAVIAGGDPNDPDDWIRSWQDDILSLAAVLDLQRDDHADNPGSGSPMTPYTGALPPYETRLDAAGVVEMNSTSWPGMCPPVPLWMTCPAGEEESTDPPYGVDDFGQGVVIAVAKDFFRFDIPHISHPTGSTPRTYIRVDTSSPAHAANLDVDLEVWFNDPASGWIDITASGARQDGPGDLWAGWTATTPTLSLGQYAVAVKSQGAYGDLGQYTVRVRGTNGLQVAATKFVRPEFQDSFDAGSLIELIEKLESREELIRLVAGLAENGVVVGSDRRIIGSLDWSTHSEVSKGAYEVFSRAMAQTSALKVVAQVIDWKAMDEKVGWEIYQRLSEVLKQFEAERSPKKS